MMKGVKGLTLTILIMVLSVLWTHSTNSQAPSLTVTIPAQTGQRGQTVTFNGTLTNTTSGTFFLNDISFTLGSGGLAFDRTPFVLNHPATLQPGQSFTGNLFNLAIGGVANGTYTGFFSVIGGGNAQAQNLLATQTFTLQVVSGGTTTGGRVLSTFDTNDEGWTVFDTGGPSYLPTFFATGGNPGGYISATDRTGGAFFFNAPAGFLGDRSSTYNQILTFDLRVTSNPTLPVAEALVLVGGGLTLYYQANAPNVNTWTPYTIPLNEAGWRTGSLTGPPTTRTEFQNTLASLSALRILGDWNDGFDTAHLDNVMVNPIPGGGSCIPGMVTWYKAEGNANDSVGNNHGTLQNGATFAPGQVGQAFSLDGSNDYVEIPDSPSFTFGSGEISVETWVRPTVDINASNETFFAQYNNNSQSGQASFFFGLGSAAPTHQLKIEFTVYQQSASNPSIYRGALSSAAIPLNAFTHVVATFKVSTQEIKIYLNGAEAATTPFPGSQNVTSIADLPTPIRIGSVNSTIAPFPFAGLIDEPTIYNRALSASEIQAIYNAGSSGKCLEVCTPLPANAVSWYKGEGNANDTLGNNNGTLQNGATFAPGRVGQAFNLDGVDDYVDIGQLSQLQGATELTVMAWVKKQQLGRRDGFVGKWDSSDIVGHNTFLLFNGSGGAPNDVGNFCVGTANNSSLCLPGTTIIPTGVWVHLVGTWRSSDGQIRIYKNGSLEGTATVGGGDTLKYLTDYPAKIGHWGFPRAADEYFPGEIDEVVILNRTLCEQEIQSIYNAGGAGMCNSSALQLTSAPANQSIFGQPVSFTASLTYAGSRAPAGTMTFKDGSTTLGTATMDVNGSAVFTTSALGVGNHGVTVVYTGDSSCNALATSALPFTVNKAATSVAITSSVNPSVNGQSVSFKAVVSPVAPGAGTPTGTVIFKDGANPLTTLPVDSSGQVLYTTSNLVTGTHSITATYSSDAHFNAGASANLTQTVSGGADLVALQTASALTLSAGETVTYTLTAANNGPETSNNVMLYDALPPGSEFVSAAPVSANCAYDGRGVNCSLGSINSGANKTVTIAVKLLVAGPNENVASVLGHLVELNTSGDNSASVITNVTADATLQFSAANYDVSEGCVTLRLTVTRTGNTSEPATVDFHTTDSVALQRTDYSIGSGTLNFASGESSKNVRVLVNEDNYIEGNETAIVTLEKVKTSGSLKLGLGLPFIATFTINDNDTSPPTSNVIEIAQSFVCQQYHDFLSREPDQGGLQYWTEQITNCGSDATCVSLKRRGVSNAFFFEQEFQKTGSFVYRLYKAAYGDTVANHGYRPNYKQFAPDRARINAESTMLAQSLQDLSNLFVQRTEFSSKYPATLTGPQFVDALLATLQTGSGANLQSQRDPLISEFNTGGPGRVLYRLADDNAQNPINNRDFLDAEYNRAFVLTEYFGYLRRDPDQGGYDFWLSVVSSFPLRDTRGQNSMVCAFITSAEYQGRFSSIIPRSNVECAP